jgi:DNA-binding transcriptional LysR family regulator
LDTELLKTFLEVSRTRHFGRAAENLYLTQSAVSARVRQLEQVLGTELFTRTRNNIRLTASGERLVPHAEAALNAWERGRQAVALPADSVAAVSIAAPPSLWDSRGQQALGRVRRTMPDLALRAETHPDGSLGRRLLELQVDLILCYDPPKRYDIELRELSALSLVLVSSAEQSTLAEALDGNYLFVDWGTSFFVEHAAAFAGMPAPRLQTGSGRLALDLLLADGGAVYLPEPIVAPYLEQRRLFRVADAPVFERGVHLAYRRDVDGAPLLERVAQVIVEAGWQSAASLQP